MKLINGFNAGSLAVGAGIVLLAPIVIPMVGAILYRQPIVIAGMRFPVTCC